MIQNHIINNIGKLVLIGPVLKNYLLPKFG